MSRFFNFSALGAADPAGHGDQGHLANVQGRQPLQRYSQQQHWPNQDPGTDADPLDGTYAAGDHDDDLDAASHGETLRTQPVLGVLFNQRGGLGPAALPPCDWEGSQD